MRRLFAPLAALVVVLAVSSGPREVRAASPAWAPATIVERDGNAVLKVDGQPFFVYGAAFFYERLPRETWETSLIALRRDLHVNVLDLYVPWNWHELSDGDFDFVGRTDARRDLEEVLRLAHGLGFKLIVRPGPVIRNEWRNGGYPSWLLTQPAYGMPLRDIMEGRYPATATLQNAHSDDAAAAWMRNATHVRYAKRWLERALREFEPVAHDVLAVALDDDQGAYIDNQTWPAPHLQSYLGWLRDVVHGATNAALPVFINTYEMKVTASSPVWAMGNWYQSDAYAIGEHDRSQLEFSTGLLHTRPHQPMVMSEFQAGWLQQPQDVLPQAAAPSNTLLAMHTLIGSGVRGIINFPAQDSYDPAGWEAPFANAFYAWDAALGYDAATSTPRPPGDGGDGLARDGATRAVPTSYVGRIIETFGPALANARVVPDAGIAYLTSAYDPARLSNADIGTIAEGTIAAQRDCRAAGLTCRLVDLRYAGATELGRYPALVLPHVPADTGRFDRVAMAALRGYERAGGIVVRRAGSRALRDALAQARHKPVAADAGDATYAEDPASGAGFLTLENYDDVPRAYPHPAIRRLDGSTVRFAPFTIGARDALLLPVDIPLHTYVAGFAQADVLQTSSCPVVALGAAVGATELDVTRSTAGSMCTTRFVLAAEDGPRVVSVVSRDPHFALSPSGRVTSFAGAGVPEQVPSGAASLPIRNDLSVEAPLPFAISGGAIAYVQDVYRDGFPCVVLANDAVRLIISPAAGGRAFVFEDGRGRNAFDTIGALRDDVAIAPPPSQTDRIAKYTHQFPAGFFNRPYSATIVESGARAVVRLRYDAPDAFPEGAVFERVVTLEPHAHSFDVFASAAFRGSDPLARAQRGVLVSSFDAGDPHAPGTVRVLPSLRPLEAGPPLTFDGRGRAGTDNVAGLFDPVSHDLVMQAWTQTPGELQPSTTQTYARHATTSITLGEAGRHLVFAFETADTLDAARERLHALGCRVAGENRESDVARADCRLEDAVRNLQ
jgi:hypothetical protein